jgi:GldM N-terminal domain
MFEQKKADTVFDALKKFHNLALLNCKQDSIKERVNIRFQYLNDAKKQGEVFFRDVPAVAALTMLSKFENDVKYTENLILLNSLLKRN